MLDQLLILSGELLVNLSYRGVDGGLGPLAFIRNATPIIRNITR
ncbi:MAG TPA: hypothetical protein VE221_03815 [Sphingomicrobium sp.]|nr:hypothetical protein [Sphingomicrobium sp.]